MPPSGAEMGVDVTKPSGAEMGDGMPPSGSALGAPPFLHVSDRSMHSSRWPASASVSGGPRAIVNGCAPSGGVA
jgi:hypothetical protein